MNWLKEKIIENDIEEREEIIWKDIFGCGSVKLLMNRCVIIEDIKEGVKAKKLGD